MRYRRILLVPIVVLWAVLSSCSSSEVTQTGSNPGRSDRGRAGGDRTVESRAISIRAYRAKREPISTYIVSNTTLEAIRKVTVYARLDAIVEEILVEEGAVVREEDVLLRLEDREVRNEYEQAGIAVDEAKLGLEQADIQVQFSVVTYERALDLFQQNLISKQEFDQVSLTNRSDTLGEERARQQLEAAQARLRAATIQLEYTEIFSPIDGVITERLVEVGDRVNGNEEVFSVEEFPPLWARIFVPERDLPQLKVAQKAQVRVDTFPDRDFEAAIKMINPTVDASSGTVKVTFEMERTDRLRPGMFGTVYIATETRPDAIVIPKKAVLRERDENRIFVITAENLVEKREVVLGFSEEDRVEILEGIQEGEDVVTVGYEGLADGYAVNIISWEGESPEQAFSASAVSEPSASLPSSDRAEGLRRQQGSVSAQPGRQSRGRPAGGGPGGREMSPEIVERFMDRLMENPEVKEEYEARLARDPELATDSEKKRAFAQEMMRQNRGNFRRQ